MATIKLSNNTTMPHLKADVATFLSYRQNNREKNFNILMTHLKADVATFLSYRQNNRERIYFNYFFLCFNATFSSISAISWRPVLVVEEAGVPGENH
jgi:hypothetical protein